MLKPISQEIELFKGRYDGMKQTVMPAEDVIVITEMGGYPFQNAQYVYKRQDEKRFVFDKGYEINV
jgi:hypothetical protein